MKHNWYSKIAVAAIALVTPLVQSVVTVSPVKATTPAASVPNTICQQVKQNVSLAKGQPATHKVVGELCYKPNHKNTVHLLLSGATYGHLYWDFPLDPKRYSYVRALTNAGYATFNLDRIGIAVLEAAKYRDVNGIVLTGFLHNQGPGFGDVAASVYPAQQDPRFADRKIPDGYLTTLLGKQSIFFSKPNADPNVIALIESTAETITIAEAQGFPPLVADLNNVQGINVPVLIVVGQFDNIFCQTQCPEAQVEPTYYESSPKVEVMVLKNAGHDLNLHRNAPALFATVVEWSNRVFKY